ncbi:MAG: tRNA pseudouridine(55) synthase TruB [Dysgonamonadaceae bacterium]|jgi:tRNA pseudouridine55 synthase|nr:tRNA pseudouridine(55) synthase TruB [Dysgonamonadaceae bacterium]MDD3356978.1 tRNA pseudouridine(55) synthase TruB [Dysgonamonadaceae bacterium]MDD3727977.1 tRNA pseudouridine(55) synthase TruB [Dysgonamonadaceae bacterium]MDD4245695.1 tRNA pseudouridine(55) synthase TruB [Dysgonamonadaceae bacterium]MDD4605298.1 tRNA pseudouridine(55) synthase TruB [Dysgonamonadaceae bacterium]
MDFINGEILYVNKPLYWTSFRLVRVVRAKLREKLNIKKLKVGHAGTLDPLATGVMIICTGKKTKEIERLQAGVKEYSATIKVGATTPSFDLETEIDAEFPINHITEDLVRDCLKKFIGEIEQIPPDFSAVKVNGKRAYELARKSEVFELKPKLLVIDSIELVNYELPFISLSILCSKGTYIRALARDIGECLNSGAHLISLERVRVGDATLDKCLQVDELDEFFDKNICI